MKRVRLKLKIELVPETCGGQSLYRKLPRWAWIDLRQLIFEEKGELCRVCGSSKRLSCHEVWTYDDKASTRRLSQLQPLCGMCHHTVHFGNTEMLADKGYIDLRAVIKHFMKVNKVTRKAFDAHYTRAMEIWRRRSKREWHIEWGEFDDQFPRHYI